MSLAKQERPDVVIMDVAMPDLNGMEATRQIKRVLPQTRVIAVSMHADRHFVSEMLKAGASGYLLKDADFEELVAGLKTVTGWRRLHQPDDRIDSGPGAGATSSQDEAPNACRGPQAPCNANREVLQLLAEGNSTKEIASNARLSASRRWRRIGVRQCASSRSTACLAWSKYALREGLTTLEP